jgi:hypothetical protein
VSLRPSDMAARWPNRPGNRLESRYLGGVIAEAANTPLGEPLPVPMAAEKDVTYRRTSIFPFCTLTCNAG